MPSFANTTTAALPESDYDCKSYGTREDLFIGNKIDGAMDLLGVFLKNTVNEEIEAMKRKITDLEAKVHLLTAENHRLKAELVLEKRNEIILQLIPSSVQQPNLPSSEFQQQAKAFVLHEIPELTSQQHSTINQPVLSSVQQQSVQPSHQCTFPIPPTPLQHNLKQSLVQRVQLPPQTILSQYAVEAHSMCSMCCQKREQVE